jgi:ribonuclease BN (tRNA processing enzyme)
MNEPQFNSLFLALSCRQFDPYDSCIYGDKYWSDSVSNLVLENNDDGVDYDIGNSYGGKRMISKFHSEEAATNLDFAKKIMSIVGLNKLTNIQVLHCHQSYGICIETLSNEKSGEIKLVYSGDTRPSERLVILGKNATILIHEATFEDDKLDEAIQKKHSTISEALQIAEKMNANRIILSHFSQRYQSIPPLTNIDYSLNTSVINKTIFAFDYMSVSFENLSWAPLDTAKFARAFPPKEEKEEEEISETLINVKKRNKEIVGSFAAAPNCDCSDKQNPAIKKNRN